MDDMSYNYNRNASGSLVNNKLRHVNDGVSAGAFTEDIDNQQNDNYRYDKIGNLVSDKAEKIERINWNVYGKISSIQKTGSDISYSYDAGGNRITKTVNGKKDFYVRDAQGNVLALYEYENSSLKWAEQHLYGSSMLGIRKTGIVANGLSNDNYNYTLANDPVSNGIRGNTVYHISNHVGNVMATITDRKMGVDVDNDGQVDHFDAEVLSQTDYYPFGMKMKERSYGVQGRYGFNGQEKSLEINSDGNSMTAEFWQYDTRIGRRWNIDPVMKEWESGYSTLSNNAIWFSDYNGADTTLPSIGGGKVTLPDEVSKVETYSSSNYLQKGTGLRVPVEKGQLRSFSSSLGIFTAVWKKGTTEFLGYKNEKGQDYNTAVAKYNQRVQAEEFFNKVNAFFSDPVNQAMLIATPLQMQNAMFESGSPAAGNPSVIASTELKITVETEVKEIVTVQAAKTSSYLWKVGSYSEIKGLEVGLDAHHVGQKALMKNFVSGYNLNTAPSILVPEVGHTIRGVNGVVSRSTSGFTNARQVLARDIFELRRVYSGQEIPNSSLQQLIKMNKTMYPGAFIK